MIVPILLGGGSGTRLWPLSRRQLPKQFSKITGEATLLQATADRAAAVAGAEPPLVVCNADHADQVRRELSGAGRALGGMILEPVGRNTAPAVAAAALEAGRGSDDPLLLVLPSDHVITDRAAFADAVATGTEPAAAGHLVLFGIVPDRPETGYGYVEPGALVEPGGARTVRRFVEKPDPETARRFVASGEYWWNSGMFLFRASSMIAELGRHAPSIAACVRAALAAATRTGDVVRLPSQEFAACPAESLDYAVMERTESAAVVPLDAGWSDVGSWHRVWELADKDGSGNAVVGDAAVLDTSNSYVRSESRLVAAVGLDDVVVVETPDAVLVCRRERAEDVKDLVARLVAEGRAEAESHPGG